MTENVFIYLQKIKWNVTVLPCINISWTFWSLTQALTSSWSCGQSLRTGLKLSTSSYKQTTKHQHIISQTCHVISEWSVKKQMNAEERETDPMFIRSSELHGLKTTRKLFIHSSLSFNYQKKVFLSLKTWYLHIYDITDINQMNDVQLMSRAFLCACHCVLWWFLDECVL